MNKGFSLVELSVVLVILGLLVGGVVGGRSLVKAAEIKKFGAELSHYASAVLQYRDKYSAFPGDHDNATEYWPGKTHNGNGDGTVGDHWNSADEDSKAMQHLALAGLINHKPSTSYFPQVVGQNIPAGPYSKQGYRLQSFPYEVGACCTVYGREGVAIIAGRVASGADVWNGFLTPADAWHIDTKMDDGTPEKGDWLNQSKNANSCNQGNGGANAPQTKGSNTYKLEDDSEDCNIIYLFK